MKKLNNKGLSLIEILIVLAIMGVVTAMATVSFAIVNNSNASKAANNYIAALDTAKTQCMAKGADAGKLTVKMLNGKLYYNIGPDDADNLICGGNIKVYNALNAGSPVEITSDGVVGEITFNTAGMVESSSTMGSLIFEGGNKKVKAELFYETGKHAISAWF